MMITTELLVIAWICAAATHVQAGRGTNSIGASTVGVLYPRTVATELVAHMRAHGHEDGTDRLISTWREATGRRQYVVVPCLVEHRGMFSSHAQRNEVRHDLSFEELWKQTLKHASKFDDYAAGALEKEERVLVRYSSAGVHLGKGKQRGVYQYR